MSSTWYFYVSSHSYFLILLFIYFSFIPYYSLLLVLLFLFFSHYSSLLILLFSFFSSNYHLLTFKTLCFITDMHINNLYIKSAKCYSLRKNLWIMEISPFANTTGYKDPGVKRQQGILYPRERQNPLKLPVLGLSPGDCDWTEKKFRTWTTKAKVLLKSP